MCPIDPSPHAGEVLHEPEKQFPKPTPDVKHEDKPHAEGSIADRPGIPAHSAQMAVDVEDEEDDPVIESGPGLDHKQTSLFTKD